MIYKSLLPILIMLLIMVTLTTYLVKYVSGEATRALILENDYLLTINVFRQLNATLPQIMRYYACPVIMNPLKNSYTTVAENLTITLNEVLDRISNETRDAVSYEVLSYGIQCRGNETIYHALIHASTQTSGVMGMIMAVYPFNLCYYSQVISDVASGLSTNVTVHANTIAEAAQDISKYLMGKVGYHEGINITLNYVGVFKMISRSHNQTVYWGPVYYTMHVTPSENLCGSGAGISGEFYATIVINAYVNNTYYFVVNGAINNDN